MKIDWDSVDEFQRRAGTAAAYGRACDFMIAYLSQVQAPFPTITVETLGIAKNLRDGKIDWAERKKALEKLWGYLGERKASTDFTTPEYCIVRAIIFVLHDLEPQERDVSEDLHMFLYLVNKFEDHTNVAPLLVQKFFGTSNGVTNVPIPGPN